MKNKGKTVLILGGSFDQLFAIETAKKMGFFTVVLDYNPNSIGFQHADDHAVVSTRDLKALTDFVSEYQRKRKIDGVMTMGSDIPMSVAVVAEVLGSPAISRETAAVATDKVAMKKRWAEHGISVPWFTEISTLSELQSIVRDRGHDLVIKPLDQSGARGVFRLSAKADTGSLFEESKRMSRSGRVMVEEFIEGPQLSTESIIYDDFFTTAGMSDRNYDMNPHLAPNMIENGGTMPSSLPAEHLERFNDMLHKAAKALGIRRGVAKGDGVYSPTRGPVMFEMAARLSGGYMSSGLIPVSSGINIVETVLDISVGNEPNLDALKPRWWKGAALRYFFPKPGVLRNVEGIDEVRKQPWVHALDIQYEIGARVPSPSTHGERFGGFLVEGDTRAEAETRARWVYDTVRITTTPA